MLIQLPPCCRQRSLQPSLVNFCQERKVINEFAGIVRERLPIQIVMPLLPAQRNGRRFVNPVPTSVGGLSMMFKIGPQFFLGAAARSPRGPLGPFRTDPRIYGTNSMTGLRITWFGHASSLVEIDGVRVLIDPVWDERAAPTADQCSRWSRSDVSSET